MNNETVNQEIETVEKSAEAQEAKTFTQAELDTIVSDRLKRERAKYADYNDLKEKAQKFDEAEEAGKSELQRATERADALQAQLDRLIKDGEIRSAREKVSAETGVPINLLTGDDEDTCKAQAEALLSWKKPEAYPAVKDSGEIGAKVSTGKTRDQFAEWLEQATK